MKRCSARPRIELLGVLLLLLVGCDKDDTTQREQKPASFRIDSPASVLVRHLRKGVEAEAIVNELVSRNTDEARIGIEKALLARDERSAEVDDAVVIFTAQGLARIANPKSKETLIKWLTFPPEVHTMNRKLQPKQCTNSPQVAVVRALAALEGKKLDLESSEGIADLSTWLFQIRSRYLNERKSVDDLISTYQRKPTAEIRIELLRRRSNAGNEFIEGLYFAEPSSCDRGDFHLGVFANPLSDQILGRLSSKNAVKGLNAKIDEHVHSGIRDMISDTVCLFNTLQILSKVGGNQSERVLAKLAYTSFDIRVMGESMRCLEKLELKDRTLTFDEWWNSNKGRLFDEQELAELAEIKRLNAKSWSVEPMDKK